MGNMIWGDRSLQCRGPGTSSGEVGIYICMLASIERGNSLVETTRYTCYGVLTRG